jgi:hypothetical protein
MSEPLIWIHGDCLDPRSPVLRRWPTARRLFVFDDAILDRYHVSFKRIVFLFESLLEIEGIEIHQGSTVPVLLAAAAEANTSRLVTIGSVAPGFRRMVRRLETEGPLTVEVVPPEPFVALSRGEDDRLDLKRFSRYWQVVKGRALSLNRSLDELI